MVHATTMVIPSHAAVLPLSLGPAAAREEVTAGLVGMAYGNPRRMRFNLLHAVGSSTRVLQGNALCRIATVQCSTPGGGGCSA